MVGFESNKMAYIRVLDQSHHLVKQFSFSEGGKKKAYKLARKLAESTQKRHFIKSLGEHELRYDNPGGKHLAGASPKENRQYEHILQSELAHGYGLKRAKSIAAATVRKGQAKKRRSRR